MKKQTRGNRNIDWIERFCYVPEGKNVGQPMVLRPWQKTIIRSIYDTPTRRAIITFARKSGKTCLSAMLLLLHLAGPEAHANSQLFSCAQSREQAGLVYSMCAKMVRINPALHRYIAIRETAKELLCPELGTRYRALSAEASTALGTSPIFTIFDELGQVRGPRSALFEALETGSSAHGTNALTVVISTQAAVDGDLLSLLIDDAQTGLDPLTKLFMWTAALDIDPFSDEALQSANPAMGDFQSAEELRRMANDAKRLPSRESEYRNLCLNQRIEGIAPFIAKSTWDANGGDVADFDDHPVYCGLDLSESNDLTCLAMVCKIDDVWHCKPIFWLPEEGLAERSRRDRVPYDLWVTDGYIETTPGNAVEYRDVARRIYELWSDYNIQAVAFDRWGMKHLRPWLIESGFSEAELERFCEHGQGFSSMGPAVREMEAILLNAHVRHGHNPPLQMCAANAVCETDPAGNRKLSKKRSRGRIDGLVALTMALSVATTSDAKTAPFTSIFDDETMFPELHGQNTTP
jgi:phage terminase large subunit-like protein